MKEIEPKGRISDIADVLSEYASDYRNLWFRGQPSYEYKLRPSIFRQGNEFGMVFHEQKMFEEFKRRYPDKSEQHKTTYEWLTLMQHYGLPSRLLDWSSSLTVGLYFACVSNPDDDAALFVFDPTYMERDFHFNEFMKMQVEEKTKHEFYRRLVFNTEGLIEDSTKINGISIAQIKNDLHTQIKFYGLSTGSTEDFNSLTIIQKLQNTVDHEGKPVHMIEQDVISAFSNIIPFRSPHLNPRIRQQHGFFTFHGGMFIEGQEFIKVDEMETHTYSENCLLKIRISSKEKRNILKELAYAGIREATLFPEMEYQAKEIKEEFSESCGS
ncbi:hypothetical protein NBRC116494_22220 [Aurantivibrio plasticivorans]